MEYLFYFICFIVGIFWGWKLREVRATQQIDKMVKEVEHQIEVESTILPIRIMIEKHNDVFYVYSEDDQMFMAQGSTFEDVEETLIKRFPGKRFAADPENLKEIGYIK